MVFFKKTDSLVTPKLVPFITDTPEEIYTDTSEKSRRKSSNSLKKFANRNGISNCSIERNIKKLQGENKLRRVGADRGGHWELKL